MTRAALAAVIVCFGLALGLGEARADAVTEASADRAFHAALASGDIDALEQLGAARPVTRWSDDAWSEAARLAMRASDYSRARRAFEQAIAVGSELDGSDAQLVRRARAELARLDTIAGASGEWSVVAAAHERLVPKLHAGGDPRPTLAALEQLVRAHPAYPRAAMLMVGIASGWEREGEAARAIRWLRDARATATSPADRLRAHAELVRTLIRTGEIATARAELARLAAIAPTGLRAALRQDLDRAELRRTVRWMMWIVLALLASVATISLRRAAGSWRSAARRLLRPPGEAIFLVPVAIVIVVVAHTGNPLIARAVRTIAIAGVITTWVSGAILDGHSRIGLRRALVHAGLAVLAVLAVTYLAVDRGHTINFVIETWRAGHERG